MKKRTININGLFAALVLLSVACNKKETLAPTANSADGAKTTSEVNTSTKFTGVAKPDFVISHKDCKAITFENRSKIGAQYSIMSVDWDFGDGQTYTESSGNVTHLYDTEGSYTVKMTIKIKENATGEFLEEFYTIKAVVISACPNFDVNDLDIYRGVPGFGKGLMAKNFFSDCKSISYNFGDGSAIMTETTPFFFLWQHEHAYRKGGNYTATVTAVSARGYTSTQTKIISIPFTFDVNFNDGGFRDKATGLYMSRFENYSTNAISYHWDFGDGSTSTEDSPSHRYTASKRYNVTLTATNSKGERKSITREVYGGI